jgi:XTP/dITP diphosphohydrolase
MEIVVATTNPGKIREIRLALAGAPAQLLALDQSLPEPEETGLTFADNAALKAVYYAKRTGLPTVAEDSGLAIDALGGRPGVMSARYSGETYAEKFANLYRELASHPRPWTARFVCALAFVANAHNGAVTFACAATVEGEIAPEPRGAHGFGYDPIFFYPPSGCTTSEMADDQKLVVSHRGKAFSIFAQWLSKGPGARDFISPTR